MVIASGVAMRVHLGAGKKYWPGWTNVDFVGDQDINSDICDLPFEDNSVDEIQAIHVFEHLHRMKTQAALNEWKRVLKPEGKLVLELPCLDKVTEMMASGEKNIRMTLFALYGDPREENEHMCHKWGWSEEEITTELKSCGFDVEIKEPVFHIKQRDMRIESRQEN